MANRKSPKKCLICGVECNTDNTDTHKTKTGHIGFDPYCRNCQASMDKQMTSSLNVYTRPKSKRDKLLMQIANISRKPNTYIQYLQRNHNRNIGVSV